MTLARFPVARAALAVTLATVLAACDSYADKPRPLIVNQTRVLRLDLSDEAPAPGDTIGVRAVIVDSTDTSFRYDWSLSGPGTLIGPDPSSEPTIRIALSETGYSGSTTYTIGISVVVKNGSRGEPGGRSRVIYISPRNN